MIDYINGFHVGLMQTVYHQAIAEILYGTNDEDFQSIVHQMELGPEISSLYFTCWRWENVSYNW